MKIIKAQIQVRECDKNKIIKKVLPRPNQIKRLKKRYKIASSSNKTKLLIPKIFGLANPNPNFH